ncbi:MAG TPA: hypothetical protein VIF09_11010 [Polyangiaceae bacterium]
MARSISGPPATRSGPATGRGAMEANDPAQLTGAIATEASAGAPAAGDVEATVDVLARIDASIAKSLTTPAKPVTSLAGRRTSLPERMPSLPKRATPLAKRLTPLARPMTTRPR